MQENPHITRAELAQEIGLSEDGMKYQLAQMKKKGLLKRVGPQIRADIGKSL